MPLKVVNPPTNGPRPSKNLRIRGTVSVNVDGQLKSVEVNQSAYTTNRRLAETLRARLESKITNELVYGPRVTRTLQDAVTGYAEEKDRSARPLRGTQRAQVLGRRYVDGSLSPHLLSRFGAETLCSEINQEMVDRVIRESYPQKVAAATIMNAIIIPITAVLYYAAKRKWCDEPKFTRFKVAKGRSRWPTYDEADRILAAAMPHMRPLYLFLMMTGARFSEAISLDWRDVNLTKRWAVLRDTKRNDEDRGIPLHPQVRLVLANLPGAHEEGPVFLTYHGLPYTQIDEAENKRPTIKTAWLATLRRAEITDNLRVHDLRHGFATWLLKCDVNERVQDRIMGHASATMGSRYAHIPQADMIEAVDRLPERGFDPDPVLVDELAANWSNQQRKQILYANGRPVTEPSADHAKKKVG